MDATCCFLFDRVAQIIVWLCYVIGLLLRVCLFAFYVASVLGLKSQEPICFFFLFFFCLTTDAEKTLAH